MVFWTFQSSAGQDAQQTGNLRDSGKPTADNVVALLARVMDACSRLCIDSCGSGKGTLHKLGLL